MGGGRGGAAGGPGEARWFHRYVYKVFTIVYIETFWYVWEGGLRGGRGYVEVLVGAAGSSCTCTRYVTIIYICIYIDRFLSCMGRRVGRR